MIKPMSKYFALAAIALGLVLACTSKTSENTNEATTDEPTMTSETADEPEGFVSREPNDDELNEFGVIAELEEAGYPLYTVTISFPERGMSSGFSLNVESATLSDEISKFQGQFATIYYESEESTEVLDIILNDQSLLGEYAPEDHEGLERFEGTLKGATSESGDLPGTLQIEGEEETLVFEYFVDTATIAANDQQVVVYYYKRYVDIITYLERSVD